MKGGFHLTETFQKSIPNSNYEEFFITYLKSYEETFNLISDSSEYGYIFKQDLREGSPAPAVELNSECKSLLSPDCFKPLTSYIYKVCFIGDNDKPVIVDNTDKKSLSGLKEFTHECLIQYRLFNSRFNNGFSLVPPILSEKPLLFDFDHPFLDSCKRSDNFTKGLRKAIEAGSTDIGVICMGFEENYVPLIDLLKNDEDNVHKYTMLARLAHLELLCMHKIIHGDAHRGNIMINPNYANWLEDGSTGRPIIIDFGNSRSLSPEEMKVLEDNTGKNFNPSELLSLIVKGNKFEHNSEWLTHPYCCSQCSGNNIEPDIKELIDLYRKHKRYLNSITKRIQSEIPDYKKNSSVKNVMALIRSQRGARRTRKKRRRRLY